MTLKKIVAYDPLFLFIILLLSRGKAKLAKSETQDSTKTFFSKRKIY